MRWSTLSLIMAALLAFAGNSLLCRLALSSGGIDPASFTAIRLISGALVLAVLLKIINENNNSEDSPKAKGTWLGAVCLFIYATSFSFGYLHLDTGTGALIVFGAVQLTMVGAGFYFGERLNLLQFIGFFSALAGLLWLLLPGASTPSYHGALLMIVSGVAWAGYSLLGRGISSPLKLTAGNFWRAAIFGIALLAICSYSLHCSFNGVLYALLSGTLASGIGYAIWYMVLSHLSAFQAAGLQLSVPVLAALAGALFLSEALTLHLLISSIAVLGGVAVMLWAKSIRYSS